MIGTLITPTRASTAPARSDRRTSSIDDWSEMNPMYKNRRIRVEVSRASQTHQTPHAGRPQREPVASEIKVNMAPVGEIAVAIIEASLALKAQPIPAYTAISTYRNIPIQAAGT